MTANELKKLIKDSGKRWTFRLFVDATRDEDLMISVSPATFWGITRDWSKCQVAIDHDTCRVTVDYCGETSLAFDNAENITAMRARLDVLHGEYIAARDAVAAAPVPGVRKAMSRAHIAYRRYSAMRDRLNRAMDAHPL